MATIRFRELVKRAGKPEPKSLWTDPKRDAQFTRAVRQHRVLTVVQEPGRKDFGEVGFRQQPHASYFVFPKPLDIEEKARVIGIKYDLVEQPAAKDALSSEALEKFAPRRMSKRARLKKSAPPEKAFEILVRRVAAIETNIRVTARSKADAKRKAVETAKSQPFNLSKAVFRTEAR